MQPSIEQEIHNQKKRGVLLVLTGPTGAGKDAVLEKLQSKNPSLVRIVTTTSREKRPGESEGKPYHFINRDQFEKKIANGDFFEWVEFRGNLYGTEKKELHEALQNGHDVAWKIEAKGVKNIKQKVKETIPRSVFVYLSANSMQVLEKRVRKAEAEPDKRWNPSLVSWEMEQFTDSEYLVINEENELEKTVEKVHAIMEAKRLETTTQREKEGNGVIAGE